MSSNDTLPTITLAPFQDKIEFAKLWHLRLGHIPFTKMKILFPDFDITTIKNIFLCTICPQSRQTRLAFQDSNVKSTNAFELLHMDVWGPYNYKTHNTCNTF